MLVFGRKAGEKIRINDDIVITVTEVRGTSDPTIRIGIDAPPEVPVHREEVYQAIRKGNDETDHA